MRGGVCLVSGRLCRMALIYDSEGEIYDRNGLEEGQRSILGS